MSDQREAGCPMTHPHEAETAGDELLREMIAGCEGVTPGPWSVYTHEYPWRIPQRTYVEAVIPEKTGTHVENAIGTKWTDVQLKGPYPVVSIAYGIGDAEPVQFVNIKPADAAHIARCDPATIKSMAEELLAWRAAAQRDVAGLIERAATVADDIQAETSSAGDYDAYSAGMHDGAVRIAKAIRALYASPASHPAPETRVAVIEASREAGREAFLKTPGPLSRAVDAAIDAALQAAFPQSPEPKP